MLMTFSKLQAGRLNAVLLAFTTNLSLRPQAMQVQCCHHIIMLLFLHVRVALKSHGISQHRNEIEFKN